MRYNFYNISVLILVLLASCKKPEHLSPVPSVEFKSFTVFDSIDPLGNFVKAGRLKFDFKDGDGDMGLESPTNGQTDSTNLFLELFRKTGGSMLPAAENDPLKPSSYRIPYMERLGQNKILKGTISVVLLYLFYEPKDSTVIRYDFYIKDRAHNVSNVVSTSEIKLSVNSVYD